MLNRYTATLAVLFVSLACGGTGGPSELALEECAPLDDATECDRCFLETCQQQCYDCVDDPVCYACTQGEADEACQQNERIALLLTCALGSIVDCADACAGQPPPVEPDKPPRLGKGRRGGARKPGGGGGRPGGGGGPGGAPGGVDDGGREGKVGKGGKAKRPQ